jgi:hypothetical protein
MATPPNPSNDESISIALHPKHWVIIMAAIDALNQTSMKRLEELKRQGVDHTTLPSATITALAAPMIVRGILTKELTDHGVMTPESNEKFGIEQIMKAVEDFRRSS